jgi:formylglycine-generating enzyme required for sulfatase activity
VVRGTTSPDAADADTERQAVDSGAASTKDASRPKVDGCAQDLRVTEDCEHPEVATDCHDGWCRIPAGCFVMGSPMCEVARGANSENQSQTVLTHPFYMKQYEVTGREWARLGLKNPGRSVPGQSDCTENDCPVGSVMFHEALEYANRLSAAEGRPACYTLVGCQGVMGEGMQCSGLETTTPSVYDCGGYRLPTDAEWEYAVRAGTTTAFYSGFMVETNGLACSEEPALLKIGWYCFNSGKTTHPVGLKAPNAWGLYDMSGNAAEWTSDGYDGVPFKSGVRVDPGAQVPRSGERTNRPGSAMFFNVGSKSAARLGDSESYRAVGQGFRLARTITK